MLQAVFSPHVTTHGLLSAEPPSPPCLDTTLDTSGPSCSRPAPAHPWVHRCRCRCGVKGKLRPRQALSTCCVLRSCQSHVGWPTRAPRGCVIIGRRRQEVSSLVDQLGQVVDVRVIVRPQRTTHHVREAHVALVHHHDGDQRRVDGPAAPEQPCCCLSRGPANHTYHGTGRQLANAYRVLDNLRKHSRKLDFFPHCMGCLVLNGVEMAISPDLVKGNRT